MRRSFVSAAVAVAMLGAFGLAGSSHAGTVNIGGDTSVEMFGLVNLATGWMTKLTMQGNGVSTNTSYNGRDCKAFATFPGTYMGGYGSIPEPLQDALDKKSWNATSVVSRLGFRFENKSSNISGVISGDFWGTPSYPHGATGLFRLRKAYVKHELSNGMYILFGQDADVGEVHNFSMAWQKAAGFNLVSGSPWAFSPQIQIGGKFSVGSESSVDFKVAAEQEDYVGDHINSLGIRLIDGSPAYLDVGGLYWEFRGESLSPLYKANAPYVEAASVDRRVLPTFAADVGFNLAMGFGKPMRLYSFGFIEPVELSYDSSEHSKNSYGGGVGLVLPVSEFTFQSEYIFTRGATGMAGVKAGTFVPIMPPKSYVYDKTNHKLITRTSQAFSLEAKFQPLIYLGFSGGYYQLNFFNDGAGSDVFFVYPGAIDNNPFMISEAKSIQSMFANIIMYTSRHTGFVVEWDRVITKYAVNSPNPLIGVGSKFDTAIGNAVWFGYTYVF